MTPLDRRDRARARNLAEYVVEEVCNVHDLGRNGMKLAVDPIAAALKAEREQAWFASLRFFWGVKAAEAAKRRERKEKKCLQR